MYTCLSIYLPLHFQRHICDPLATTGVCDGTRLMVCHIAASLVRAHTTFLQDARKEFAAAKRPSACSLVSSTAASPASRCSRRFGHSHLPSPLSSDLPSLFSPLPSTSLGQEIRRVACVAYFRNMSPKQTFLQSQEISHENLDFRVLVKTKELAAGSPCSHVITLGGPAAASSLAGPGRAPSVCPP